jgi:hypothetical protein
LVHTPASVVDAAETTRAFVLALVPPVSGTSWALLEGLTAPPAADALREARKRSDSALLAVLGTFLLEGARLRAVSVLPLGFVPPTLPIHFVNYMRVV